MIGLRREGQQQRLDPHIYYARGISENEKMQNRVLILLRRFTLLFACAMLVGCFENAQDTGAMATATHRNGLRIVASVSYTITETADGFELRPATARREVDETVIEVHDRPPAATGDIQTKRTEAGKVAYTVQALNGGSGGTEYALTAWRPMGERWIVLTAVQQREWGKPGFVEVWNMLETATLSKSKKER